MVVGADGDSLVVVLVLASLAVIPKRSEGSGEGS
jgi:hypothetical protein